MQDINQEVQAAVQLLADQLDGRQPGTLIVLGTGLAVLADQIVDAITVPYSDIPGFSVPTTEGHIGELVFGYVRDKPVTVMKGKIFSFEASGINGMRAPIRTFYKLGVRSMFYSSSVGSLRPEVDAGALVLITDHINAMGTSPLLGDNDPDIGPQFPDLAMPYDPDYCEQLRELARQQKIPLYEGIYGAVRGPAFETRAEIRMLKSWGVDVVGMSLVPEVLLAKHCGMKVVAIANVTNLAVGLSDIPVDHDQTLRSAKQAGTHLWSLIERFEPNA